MVRAALILAALLLAGCASDPITVKVPVYQRAEPPAELLEPVMRPDGVFSAPGVPGAVACLLPAGKDLLVSHVDALRQRLGGWEAWAR